MSKNKLKKFAEMAQMRNVFEFSLQSILKGEIFEHRGCWNSAFFNNPNPIVLELGCGRGEYTVELAKNHTDKNYIGVDIKGARMWHGATLAEAQSLGNVAFVRTDIQNIGAFFAEKEIAEIWITFPDPQMRKLRKRLTSTRFLTHYRKILNHNGIVHLKTDSNFLFEYTKAVVSHNSLPLVEQNLDIHACSRSSEELTKIKTYYEKQWIARGIAIKYLKFMLPQNTLLAEPEIEIPFDQYRSYGRQKRSELNMGN